MTTTTPCFHGIHRIENTDDIEGHIMWLIDNFGGYAIDRIPNAIGSVEHCDLCHGLMPCTVELWHRPEVCTCNNRERPTNGDACVETVYALACIECAALISGATR